MYNLIWYKWNDEWKAATIFLTYIDFKDTQIHDNLYDGFCQRYDSDHTSAYKHLLYLGIENFIFLTNYSIPSGDSGGFLFLYSVDKLQPQYIQILSKFNKMFAIIYLKRDL